MHLHVLSPLNCYQKQTRGLGLWAHNLLGGDIPSNRAPGRPLVCLMSDEEEGDDVIINIKRGRVNYLFIYLT